jgi:hypothetical protein
MHNFFKHQIGNFMRLIPQDTNELRAVVKTCTESG